MALTKKQKRLLRNSEELLTQSMREAGYDGELDPRALKMAKKIAKSAEFDPERAIASLRRATKILEAV